MSGDEYSSRERFDLITADYIYPIDEVPAVQASNKTLYDEQKFLSNWEVYKPLSEEKTELPQQNKNSLKTCTDMDNRTSNNNSEAKNNRNKSSISFSDEQPTGYGTVPSSFPENEVQTKKIQFSKKNQSHMDPGAGPPQSTIMSLADRDVVVIDKKDINESTKNGKVLIVDPVPNREDQQNLMDLLKGNGSTWPPIAGTIGDVLNSSEKISYSQTVGSSSVTGGYVVAGRERNKSANPIAHIGNTTMDKNKEDKQMGARKSKYYLIFFSSKS